ncbi:helix-turn-helix domain-containing protein [Siphonobacter sp.]|uniref:helix-turn-helix domain-containing protein n=1 Tax=Siphonobacter sp. TaxID=1869184 RepID=UPI003B3A5EF1
MKYSIDISQLPERLEFVKRKFGLSNGQIGNHAEVSGSAITLILNRKTSKPKFDTLMKLSDSLGISLKWLATGEGSIDDVAPAPKNSKDSGTFGQDIAERFEQIFKEWKAENDKWKAENEFLKDQIKEKDQQIKVLLGKSEGIIYGPLCFHFHGNFFLLRFR